MLLNCVFNLLFLFKHIVSEQRMCVHVSCTFVLNVCMLSLHQPSNIERNDTLWSRTWIAHWFLGASLTIHSNWFLALLGVRVMAVLMYHLYVYSSPTARGFTIVCAKCIYSTVCRSGTGTLSFFFFFSYYELWVAEAINLQCFIIGEKNHLYHALFYIPTIICFWT